MAGGPAEAAAMPLAGRAATEDAAEAAAKTSAERAAIRNSRETGGDAARFRSAETGAFAESAADRAAAVATGRRARSPLL